MKRVTLLSAVAVMLAVPAMAWADGACCEKSIAASPCNSCKTECNSCKPICEKRCVQCCHNKTSYHLVKECTPVCREKQVCHKDPCNPCNVTRSTVTECHNKTSYRWVAETKPSCHTKTIKVCHLPNAPIESGTEDTSTASTRTKSNVQLAAMIARK